MTTKSATVFVASTQTSSCSKCGTKRYKTISKLKPTIKLSKSKVTIKVKKNYILKITGLAKGDSVKSVISSKKKSAVVGKYKTNQYKIIGKKKGKAIITVKLKSGKTAKCTVTVK